MSRITVFVAAFCAFLVLGAAHPTEPSYEELNAILWMQTSVEYQATSVQTYRLARNALVRGLKDPHWTAALEQNGDFEKLPPAVILDLDETVLDNSAFEARSTLSGEPYSADQWSKWVREEKAGLVPGALDFLQFAHAKGVASLYITNRACDPSNEGDPTVQVLRQLQVPLDPVQQRLFCLASKNAGDKKLSDPNDKTARRRQCAASFRILLMFGDQLSDFLQIPHDMASVAGRQKLFDAHQELWGTRWFQLANPMYGSWVDADGHTVPEKVEHLRH